MSQDDTKVETRDSDGEDDGGTQTFQMDDVHPYEFLSVPFPYCETTKRKVYRTVIYECRWDGRLKPKPKGSTLLTYTGLCGGLDSGQPKDRDEVNKREV